LRKIIFFQPHPDDLELKCAQLIHHLAIKCNQKFSIKIAAITKGEFGLPGYIYDKFKGELLANVRTKELLSAMSFHNIKKEQIYFFGYLDGCVKFNNEFIKSILSYLEKEKPDIIFAPEAYYTSYYHADHVNTGKALYYIIHKKMLSTFPKLFFYSTLSPNRYFGFDKKDLPLVDDLLHCHKTQFWLLNKAKILYKITIRLAGLHVKGHKYAEKYRRVYFSYDTPQKNKISYLIKILSHWFASWPWFKAKYPLGFSHETS
jgi:hypothetical protein